MGREQRSYFRPLLLRLIVWFVAAIVGGVGAGLFGFNIRSDNEAPFALDTLAAYWEGMQHLLTSWEHIQILLIASFVFAFVSATLMHYTKHYGLEVLKRKSAFGRPKLSRHVRQKRAHLIALYLLGQVLHGMLYSYIGYLIWVAYQPLDRMHWEGFREVLWRPYVILMNPANHPGFEIYLGVYVTCATLLAIYVQPIYARYKADAETHVPKVPHEVLVARSPQEYYKPVRRSFLGRLPQRPVGYQYQLFVDTIPSRKWYQFLE